MALRSNIGLSGQATINTMVSFFRADLATQREKEVLLFESKKELDQDHDTEVRGPQLSAIEQDLKKVSDRCDGNNLLLSYLADGFFGLNGVDKILQVESKDGNELWVIFSGDVTKAIDIDRAGLEDYLTRAFGVNAFIMTTDCHLAQQLMSIQLETGSSFFYTPPKGTRQEVLRIVKILSD